MSAKNGWFYKLSLAVVIFGLVVISSVIMTAQVRGPRPAGAPEQVTGETFPVSNPGQITAPQPVGVPDDWSHHHVIYSNPGTAPEALARGRFEEWYRIVTDPRYILQQTKRNARATGVVAGPGFPVAWPPQPTEPNPIHPPFRPPMRPPLIPPRIAAPQPGGGVWTMSVGPSGTAATASGTFAAEPSTGTTLTITGNGNTLILTAAAANSGSCTYTSGTATVNFARSGTVNTNATNVATVVNLASCGLVVGVTATAPGSSVITFKAALAGTLGNNITVLASGSTFQIVAWDTLTNLAGGTSAVGASQYPAKYSFNYSTAFSAANCASPGPPDFVVFPTGITGSATQATIVAYDNLYTGCSGTVPSIYWAYNTGANRFATSPVLSLDGSQVALVDTTGHLVLVKWAASGGTIGSPAAITLAGSAAAYHTCTAPCYFSMLLSGETVNTTSSPFVDYTHDTLYVGGGAGSLHKVTTVFTGTPTEAGSGWPVAATTGPSGAPVYDGTSGYIYMGPATAAGGGIFKEVIPSIPVVASTAQLATTGSTEVVSAPVVDSTAQMLYVFVNDSFAGTAGSAAVYQIPISNPGFTAGASGTQELLGQGALLGKQYSGAFDNTYFTSSNGASPTGHLYVCGRASASQTPTLYQIPITAGVIGTPVVGPALATGTTDCSPIAEFYNGTSDYIFLSVNANNLTTSPISCPTGAGCLMSFDVTSPTFNTSFATSHQAYEPGGTSGIIIDNLVTSPQNGTQIYFTPLVPAGTCAGNGTTGASPTTTLNGAITAAATSITLISGTNAVNDGYMLIDSELIEIETGGGTTTVTVLRGQQGTTAAAHSNGATVHFESGCATQLSQAGLN